MQTSAELHFENLWLETWPQLDLHSEHKLDSYLTDWQRRKATNPHAKCYQSDYVSLDGRVVIEIEGRDHRKTERYERDLLKYNLIAEAGYVLFRLTPEMITVAELERIGNVILERSSDGETDQEGQQRQLPERPQPRPKAATATSENRAQ